MPLRWFLPEAHTLCIVYHQPCIGSVKLCPAFHQRATGSCHSSFPVTLISIHTDQPCLCTAAQVASLVAVLKAARQLSLVKELEVVSVPGHPPVRIPGALLRQAISHANEGLLVDAMTLACVHPKTATMPGAQIGPSSDVKGQQYHTARDTQRPTKQSQSVPVRVPGALLRQAIAHANEGLLVDAMTLACVHPKTATMPGVR